MVKNYHITPRDSGQWALKREGTSRAANIFENQSDAFEAGRNVLKKTGGELFTHDRNNRFRERNTYGKSDPFPPRG